jgi:hypothetical protein
VRQVGLYRPARPGVYVPIGQLPDHQMAFFKLIGLGSRRRGPSARGRIHISSRMSPNASCCMPPACLPPIFERWTTCLRQPPHRWR